MDQCKCNLFRLVISNLILRLPLPHGGSTESGSMQSHQSIFCKIFFKRHSCKISDIPAFFSNGQEMAALLSKPAAVFDLSDAEMSSLSSSKKPVNLTFELHVRSTGGPACGFSTDRLLGTLTLPLDFRPVRHDQETWFHCGWLDLDKKAKKENRLGVSSRQLHVSVRAEPDQRLSLKFTGSLKGNVEIFYVHGSTPQPAFTSTFTWGPGLEANLVLPDKPAKGLNGWLRQQLCSGEKKVELRSGWSVTICDASGSPVAVATMVVPYVPKMQPLAWLIEQLGDNEWVPWGRLAAWHAAPDPCIHIRFEKATDGRPFEWLVNPNQTGILSIDYKASRRGGFVVSTSVGGEGSRAQPTVEVSTTHVNCTEDAASYVALAAAINLSVDACRPFI
ncbi:hypothetical protein FCM35_KLT18641 [Carex littledalei]|uniref:Uncharacterized protein n=1 Tax=Carex littledalei TaxID=544730 RepID=A0A833VZ21_9POAL|nr:hypothetical protein FCM35_KLT18641 [Carex littledalei]